jgi:hypothetical protein
VSGVTRGLTAIAARLVLLEAAFLAVVLLMMLAARDDGPGRTVFGVDWPASAAVVLGAVVVVTYAGLALLRPSLLDRDASPIVSGLNVASVVVVALLNARSLFALVLQPPSTMPVLLLIYALASCVTVVGALLAVWKSWQEGRAGISESGSV